MIRPSKHHKLALSGIPHFLQQKFSGFQRKLEKTRGVTFFFNWFPCQKMKKIFFLFSMMWLYPVLFSINSRLQKCNLFACTPRMNNSRLSKHTIGRYIQLNLILIKIVWNITGDNNLLRRASRGQKIVCMQS